MQATAISAELLSTVERGSLRVDDLGGELRRQWNAMQTAQWNPYLLYQSPPWFDHVCATGREKLYSPLALRAGDSLQGLALPYRKQHLLTFQVRNRALWQMRLRMIAFLGCEPSVPQEPAIYDWLLESTLAADPHADGIYFHSVRTDGFLWNYLHRSPWVARHLLIHVPDGVRRFHALELPSTLEEYLASQFRKKKRYNLKRQVRLLEEAANGDLKLRRVETPEDAAWFAQAASHVAGRSWQARRMVPDTFESLVRPEWLEDLAERGLLRSYVLLCAGKPCAMVLGYQLGDLFHYSETSYDEHYAAFSPGSVLLFLLIEDLFAHRTPKWVSFGAGDSRYKAEFANRHWNDAAVLLLRRRPRGMLVRSAHASFRGTIEWIKRRYTDSATETSTLQQDSAA